MTVAAPIRYFGSKWRIADWIVQNLPTHRGFVEVFGGSAAVLLSKPRSAAEVYNDLNGDVVHLFRTLRDHGDELARLIALTPYAREEHAQSFEPTDDPIERARRFVTRSWQTRGGYQRESSSKTWWYDRRNLRGSAPQSSWTRIPDRLRAVAERLQGVAIECDPWDVVLDRHFCIETCFYLDPPYLMSTRTCNRPVYVDEWTRADHEAFLARLVALGDGLFAISGYRSDLYDQALAGWRRIDTAALAQSGSPRIESLWLSPAAAALSRQMRLFTDNDEGKG